MVKKAVKKSIKKAVVPKNVSVPAKQEVKVTIRKQILGQAPEEKTFVLHDGRKLKTVYELIDELETMDDGVFREYVCDLRNDFANWINDVFSEVSLAGELRKIHTRIDTQRAILKHVVRELEAWSKK